MTCTMKPTEAIANKPESKPVSFGKYPLLEKIGEGGMAELHKARSIDAHGAEKLLAIKRILPHLSGERDLAKAFLEEAKLAALLNHENIVRVYDSGQIKDSYFIVMDYLLGKDLQQIFDESQKRGLPFSFEHALFIAFQICSGLDYAHKLTDPEGQPLHIVHRDISPQNILITYEGVVKIVDFGIVRAASKCTVTKHEMLKKKVAYSSPEQALGEKVDSRSDIFCAGLLLYEMITNRKVYSGSIMQVLAKVRKAEIEPPEAARSGLSPKIYKILGKALAKEKGQRYQSCGEMLADIEEGISELSSRPTAQGLAEYMKELFGQEARIEEISDKPAKANPIPTAPRMTPDPPSPGDQASPQPVKLDPARPAPRHFDPPVPKKVTPEQIAFDRDDPDREKPNPRGFDQRTPPGSDLKLVKDILEKAKATVEEERISTRKRRMILSAALAVVLVAVLGWAFWPKEEPVSPVGKEALVPLLSDPSKDTALAKAALSGGVQKAGTVIDRHTQAKDLQDKGVALAEKDPQKALSLLLKAVDLDPMNIQGYFQLGLVYMALKNSPKAIEAYQTAIELDPKFVDAYFNLGYIFATKKNYSKAEQMYAQVVKLAPPYLDEALYNLSLVQEKQGKREQCVNNLERALQANPKNHMAQKFLDRLKRNS